MRHLHFINLWNETKTNRITAMPRNAKFATKNIDKLFMEEERVNLKGSSLVLIMLIRSAELIIIETLG